MTAMNALVDMAWPDVPHASVLLVPVGSIEQHGPHLPLDTDTVIADAVARRVAALLVDATVVLAPPLAFGSSGEHQGFPGTISIGAEVLRHTAIELVRSATHWADKVIFVNGHGGNVAPLRSAVRQLRAEGHAVDWMPCAAQDGDLHAGRTETSLMLHLRPGSVHLDRAEAGNLGTLDQLLPAMVSGGVGAVSPNGVLGDPHAASAEEGIAILTALADSVAHRVAGHPAVTR